MIQGLNRYTNKIDGNKLISDYGNQFKVVNQKYYAGKTENGNIIIKPGATFSLQILKDISNPPYFDKKTGEKVDNSLETFDATIVNCDYPLKGFEKGTIVSLGGYLMEYSSYFEGNLYLRFSEIKPYSQKVSTNQQQVNRKDETDLFQ